MTNPIDPLLKQIIADSLLERIAKEFSQSLHELAAALNPFPAFLDLQTVQAIEVEPDTPNPDLGCVVVCPDGELYELNLHMISGSLDVGDIDQVEEFKELELPSVQYIPYAYQAIQELAKRLQEQQAGR